ncbi:MAG: hypothetical protein K8R89_03005 [Anaerolineae bacterium]|nr:hypothetical protein [Anaerolineae bacterium]
MTWPFVDFKKEKNLDPNDEGYEDTIKNRLGDFALWRIVVWDPSHWMMIRVGNSQLYTQRSIVGVEVKELEEVAAAQYVDDGDHILFFPMDQKGLCPRAWFEAAWSFLEHFRSNFCFYPQEAFMYKNVTLIGPPLGTRRGVAQEIEDVLKDNDWRQVERIWCSSAYDLEAVLKRRIKEGVRFRGKDELAPEADPG